MADQGHGRRRRSFQRQLTDATVVFYGQAPISLSGVDPTGAKGPDDLITIPIKAVAKATYKGFKEYQGVLGGGSRSSGFEHGEQLLADVADSNGRHSPDTLHGLRDGLLHIQPQSEAPEYLAAFARGQGVSESEAKIPEEHTDYPRTVDGYRGGVIAAVAIRYADVLGKPMLGRGARVIHGTKTPKASLKNLVYGAGASVAGSVLDAVKEVTTQTVEGLRGAADQSDQVREAIEVWQESLEQVGEGAFDGGPDEAISAAARSVAHISDVQVLIASASEELAAWQQEL